MAYGQVQENNYLNGGINENVHLLSFTLTQVSTERYQGEVIDVVIGNGTSKVSKRFFPINPPQDPSDSEQVKAYDNKTTAMTTYFKMLIGENYTTKEKWTAAMAKVEDFKSLYEACKSLLPENYDTIPARVVLSYSRKGADGKYYLELPAFHWLNKPWTFFTTDPSKELGISDRIIVNRPEEVEDSPVAGDDVPW
jgi:hypothetical protein